MQRDFFFYKYVLLFFGSSDHFNVQKNLPKFKFFSFLFGLFFFRYLTVCFNNVNICVAYAYAVGHIVAYVSTVGLLLTDVFTVGFHVSGISAGLSDVFLRDDTRNS